MTAIKVIKRDGKKAPFDKERIFQAIVKAAEVTEEFGITEARKITEIVSRYIDKIKKLKRRIPVEEIQDTVEFALMSSGYFKTARAYIVYREKRAQVRSTQNVVVEVDKTMSEYLNRSDWRVNANANQGYSLGGLILNTAGKFIANYWLNFVYPTEVP